MKEFNQHIKLADMARLLSRSVKQFRADVHNHSIPHLRLGRDKLFDPDLVIRYLSVQPKPPEKSSIKEFITSSPPSKKLLKEELKTNDANRYKSLLGLK